MILKTYIILIITLLLYFENSAQTDTLDVSIYTDSLITIEADTLISDSLKKSKPSRAFLYSAIVPGLGQAYNKKYWKIPVVYSALGSAAFFFNKNNLQYKRYLKGLVELYQYDQDTTTALTIFEADADKSKLTLQKDVYRRNRDLNMILFFAVYLLNAVDANIDAHLSDFDVSDDLSIQIKPDVLPIYAIRNYNTIGLTLCLKF